MKQYSFFIQVYANGSHSLGCSVIGPFHGALEQLLWQFGHSISELIWLRKEVQKLRATGEKKYFNQNDWGFNILSEISQFYIDKDSRQVKEVPTQVVIDFISSAIDFRNLYESGKIEGLISDNLKNDYTIVPNEFIKSEYWDDHKP